MGRGYGGNVNQKDSHVIMENLEKNTKISTLSLAQQWKHIQQSSGDPSHLIIGAKNYNPSRWKVSNREWNSLEKRAASGPRGVPRENFKPSVLVMDYTTSNSEMPVCVVNGKSVRSAPCMIPCMFIQGSPMSQRYLILNNAHHTHVCTCTWPFVMFLTFSNFLEFYNSK